ncbi:MAG: hypothetical protein GFH25_541180n371 [Chloroflexi bacterium AL-N10]|nr:hypothetical protein [Chloroflexi bacterium AL-N10]NOK72328.1 hypothetical protein [Chloroflexi bacterium AL-N5]NOK87501.1 hypothetical protein [Chloroflexi bacterium AL-N15]
MTHQPLARGRAVLVSCGVLLLLATLLAAPHAYTQPAPPLPDLPQDPIFVPSTNDVAPPMIDDVERQPVLNRTSNRTNLSFGAGDNIPDLGPAVTDHQIFLPLLSNSSGAAQSVAASTSSMRSMMGTPVTDAPTLPAARTNQVPSFDCPSAPPRPDAWVSRHNMNEATFFAVGTQLGNAGFRPISISAEGEGSDIRYHVIWIQDEIGLAGNWGLRLGMTGADYQAAFVEFDDAGFRPIAIDAYGSGSNPLYIVVWIRNQDDTLYNGIHGVSEETLLTEMDSRADGGFYPIWVSGHTNGESPTFSAIWVNDGQTRQAATDMTTNTDSWRERTDDGYRLLQVSSYQVDTEEGDDEEFERRYAATWVEVETSSVAGVDDCDFVQWEGFLNQNSTEYQVKASAQTALGESKIVVPGLLTLDNTDFGEPFRIAHLELHAIVAGDTITLDGIQGYPNNNIFQHGDIVVLRTRPGDTMNFVEQAGGNLRLRTWNLNTPAFDTQEELDAFCLFINCPPLVGQSFLMHSHQYQLVLQYDAEEQVWNELQRNDLAPDRYYPISLDGFGGASGYASVWVAYPSTRRWQVEQINTINDPNSDQRATLAAFEQEFDARMEAYMRQHNIPGGTLAIAVDGRLVLARGYTWDDPRAAPVQPNSKMRIASMSKPITAMAIMKLSQEGRFRLDQPVASIAEMASLFDGANWTDQRIEQVTTRQLLQHTGGWNRKLSDDYTVESDFDVCASQEPPVLPTTVQPIIDFASTKELNHDPGWAHAYSNFGYTLLGRIIERVSGQSYDDYVRRQIFTPLNINNTLLTGNLYSERHPNEVTYYEPTNPMTFSRLGFADSHPLRMLCLSEHADIVPGPYGGYNLPPMDSHGGWVSTAPDLVRLLVAVEQDELLNEASRQQMWSRPDNRARRVFFGQSNGNWTDYSVEARTVHNTPLPLPDSIDLEDVLHVGKGLSPFGTITVGYETDGSGDAITGDGYQLELFYWSHDGWKPITEDEHALDDGSESFSIADSDGEATIRFDAPLDWQPLISFTDEPLYYVMMRTGAVPTKEIDLAYLQPDGEASYGLGWNVGSSDSYTHTLRFTGAPQQFLAGDEIWGAQSLAYARVVENGPSNVSSGVLKINTLQGGSFQSGETLLVNGVEMGVAVGREYPLQANANHGGLLSGTRTNFVHRSDNINWVVLFNYENYDIFSQPLVSAGSVGIDNGIDAIRDDPNVEWPSWNFFP